MLDIKYTHKQIQQLATFMSRELNIDFYTPMTLKKLTDAIINFGIDIEYVDIESAENPLFVISAEYERRGPRDYVIRINKNKDEKDLIFRVAAEFGKIVLYEFPKDIVDNSPYTGSYSIKTKYGEDVDNYVLFAIDIGPLISSCIDKDELFGTFVRNLVINPVYVDIEELYDFEDKIMYKFTMYRETEWFVEVEKKHEEKINEL